MSEHKHVEREHFFGAAKVMAVLTVLSRILGLIRDAAILSLGANRLSDIFWTAFKIPNVFRRLFGEGALSAAFVPVFTDVCEKDPSERARLVMANIAGVLALVLSAVVIIGEIVFAIIAISLQKNSDYILLCRFSMIVLPFMFTICMLALGSAGLQCKGKFAYPAFAPILLNIFLIAGVFLARMFVLDDSATDAQTTNAFFILCGCVIVAGVIQILGVLWCLKSVGLAVVPKLKPVLTETKRMGTLFVPMLVPLGVVQISSFFDGFFALFVTATEKFPTLNLFGMEIQKPLQSGVVTQLYTAERLYNFPLGILAISLATAVFPLFSRYASRNDTDGLRDTVNRSLRLSVFMGIPAGVALILIAQPAITLLKHGKFQYSDVVSAAEILQMYCLGMWAYFANHILLRAFFAQQDSRTPLKVSIYRAILNMLMVVFLVFTPLEYRAFGIATATTSTLNVIVLVLILRSRWGQIGLRKIILTTAKTAIATAAMSGIIILVLKFLWFPSGKDFTDGLIAGLSAAIAGTITFAICSWLLKCKELSELLGKAKQ